MKTIPFFPYADLFKRDEAALTEIMMGVCRRGAYILQQECRDFDANLAKIGGTIVDDNSGTIQYLRLEFGGLASSSPTRWSMPS